MSGLLCLGSILCFVFSIAASVDDGEDRYLLPALGGLLLVASFVAPA